MESYKKPWIPFGWKAALEQEEFGICAHSSCWVLGGEAEPLQCAAGRKRGL